MGIFRLKLSPVKGQNCFISSHYGAAREGTEQIQDKWKEWANCLTNWTDETAGIGAGPSTEAGALAGALAGMMSGEEANCPVNCRARIQLWRRSLPTPRTWADLVRIGLEAVWRWRLHGGDHSMGRDLNNLTIKQIIWYITKVSDY